MKIEDKTIELEEGEEVITGEYPKAGKISVMLGSKDISMCVLGLIIKKDRANKLAKELLKNKGIL